MNEYKLNDKDMKRVYKLADDIAYERQSAKAAKKGVIDLLNDRYQTYAEYYALRESEILCCALSMTGICNTCSECECCTVMTARENALKEIRAGVRTKPIKSCKKSQMRDIHIWISKKGVIHITQTM